MWDNIKAVFSVVSMLAVMALILVLAYYATKLIGQKMGGGTARAGSLQVLDSIAVGQNRMLCVVRAGKRLLLVGVTPQQISKLCDLEESDLPIAEPPPDRPEGSLTFSETLKSVLKSNWGVGAGANRKEGKKQNGD